MSNKKNIRTCPHCGAELQAFELPEAAGWNQEFHLACFNNDCQYYRRGWDWMMEKYEAKASYRYRLDPRSGRDSPIAVWSENALVDRIIKDAPKPAKNTPVKKQPVKKPPKKQVKKALKLNRKPSKKIPSKKSSRRIPRRKRS